MLPSLHAHARMALSTRFDYVVAPKVAICCMSSVHSSSHLLANMPLPDAPLTKHGVQPATYSALQDVELTAANDAAAAAAAES